VDNAHGKALSNRVIQEHRVDGLPHNVIAAEGKADVRYTARDPCMRQIARDPTRRFDEIHRIMVVFIDTGCDSKYVRVEDDVFRREADLVHQDAVCAFTNFLASLEIVRLPLLIKSHDEIGRASCREREDYSM